MKDKPVFFPAPLRFPTPAAPESAEDVAKRKELAERVVARIKERYSKKKGA